MDSAPQKTGSLRGADISTKCIQYEGNSNNL